MNTVSNATRDPAVIALASAYYEIASGSLRPQERNEVVIAAALASSPERLRGLAMAVSDPFAWVPFLRCLVEIPLGARTSQSQQAFDRLYAIGTAFLAEQELSILRPEDLLLMDGLLERAHTTLSSNTY